MSETVKAAIIGALLLAFLTNRKTPAINGNVTPVDTSNTDFERPQWGANWISNQWATVMQGTAAHSGQLKPGWHF